jgi:hypothetical protein
MTPATTERELRRLTEVQACRPEDRAMLATPAGAELVACVASALGDYEPPLRAAVAPHNTPRTEWCRRFCDEIARAAGISADAAEPELAAWPDTEDEWLTVSPQDAAQESLSYWEGC